MRSEKYRRQEPLTIPCPMCKAVPGERCRDFSEGAVKQTVHLARWEAWQYERAVSELESMRTEGETEDVDTEVA